MPFPRWLGALTLVGALAFSAQAQDRLRVLVVMESPGLLGEIATQLNATNRYWVETQKQKLVLEGPLTAVRLKGLKQNYPARLVVLGKAASGSAQLQLLDLQMGDLMEPLLLKGDPQGVAKAFVKYVRGAFPLMGQVSLVKGDSVVLDIGSQQGVNPGMFFYVRRAQNPLALPFARLEVTSVDDWISLARVRELPKGQRIQPGDHLREDSSDSLLR